MTTEQQELKDLLEKEKEKVSELEQLLEAQKHLSIADQSKIEQLEKKLEEIGKFTMDELEIELAELKALLEEKVGMLSELEEGQSTLSKKLEEEKTRAESMDQDLRRKVALLDSEQNKVKALEHSCDQLMSLLDWEKKHVLSLQDKQDELQNDIESNEEEISALKKELKERKESIEAFTDKLMSFEAMKREIIQLTIANKQRDVMIAAMLHSVGEATAIKGKAPVRRAEIFVENRERILGLDLAGLDDDVVQDRNSRALVAYHGKSTRLRTVGKVVLPLIPIGGLIVYHHHDPTLLRELSMNIGEISSSMSSSMRSHMGELRTNVGDLSAAVSARVAANVGELVTSIDTSALRGAVTQTVGMVAQATPRMNVRRG
jgi:hypothetical protein